MKSKKEIFDEVVGRHLREFSPLNYVNYEKVCLFADKYSEQIAIGFAEFILSNDIETDLRGKWIDFRVSPSKRHTSEELYNLYKQTLK